jgi:uncharacterized membrane protein YeaQ/YmgE (transglycosylase-associated protein family)
MKSTPPTASPWIHWSLRLAFATALLAVWFFNPVTVRAAESVGTKVDAVAAGAEKKVNEAGQAAESKLAELWRRIDERRLMNRTPDQLVAWVIMGLLVGGLIRQFSKYSQLTALLLGLAGSFLGGIIANLTQVDLGLGPVLIRYEDLLASLVGGLVFLIAVRVRAARKTTPK